MAIESITFHGQPALQLTLPEGDRAVVALHGAQLLSWIPAGGVERIYLSPTALFDGKATIRGGVPICWPQFNQRGPLPKHGFVRTMAWTPVTDATAAGTVAFELCDNDDTRAMWPHGFHARCEVALTPGSVSVRFMVENTGSDAFEFTMALHSYLHISDVDEVRVRGLDGVPYWNSVDDTHPAPLPEGSALTIEGEVDRVYDRSRNATAPLVLKDGFGRLSITQDPSFIDTTVWNPGARLCATLAHMPADGYRHMLCVEAAVVDTPTRVEPGQTWAGAQRLSVLS